MFGKLLVLEWLDLCWQTSLTLCWFTLKLMMQLELLVFTGSAACGVLLQLVFLQVKMSWKENIVSMMDYFMVSSPIENEIFFWKIIFLCPGGGFYLLGVQTLACVCLMAWSGLITFIQLFVSILSSKKLCLKCQDIVSFLIKFINMVIPIRMEAYEELIGADFFEHDIRHPGVGVSRAVSVLKHFHDHIDVNLEQKGYNKGSSNCSSFRRSDFYNLPFLKGHEIFLKENYSKRPFLHQPPGMWKWNIYFFY